MFWVTWSKWNHCIFKALQHCCTIWHCILDWQKRNLKRLGSSSKVAGKVCILNQRLQTLTRRGKRIAPKMQCSCWCSSCLSKVRYYIDVSHPAEFGHFRQKLRQGKGHRTRNCASMGSLAVHKIADPRWSKTQDVPLPSFVHCMTWISIM